MNSLELALEPLPSSPAQPQEEPGAWLMSPQNHPATTATDTVLLIDDDASVRTALGRVLEQAKIPVVCAAGGEEALEELAVHEPRLVITDLRMGLINGWDLLFHLRFQYPRMPIFVITALPPRATGGADRFANAFFQKPLDIEALLTAVRAELDSPPEPPRITKVSPLRPD